MIEADFKVLQSEFKKKNPQIREVCNQIYPELSMSLTDRRYWTLTVETVEHRDRANLSFSSLSRVEMTSSSSSVSARGGNLEERFLTPWLLIFNVLLFNMINFAVECLCLHEIESISKYIFYL